MSSKDEKVTLRDDGEGGGGRSSSDGGVEGGGVDVRLDGDIEEPNLDSGVDPSISVDNADVGVEQSRLQMENTKLEDGVETFTDASSGKLDEVDSERVDAVTGERLSNIDDTRLSEVDGERLDSSGGDVGGEAQAITITIMDPGSLDPSALDPGTLSGALVTTVEAQSEDATGFMVNEDGTIVVQGDEGLHAVNDVSIALINSASDNTVTSLNQVPDSERTSSIIKADNSSLSKRRDALRKDFVSVSAAEEEEEDDDEEIGRHCFICNVDLPLENPDDSISVFKTQTTSSSRKVSVILSSLVGQTLTARKAHSDIMCRRCFSLLDRVDTLEVEIKSSKEEIVTKFQNTIAMYGGRARKRKPTAAVRRDFVFPKVEPEDDYEAKELDMDDNFEPTVDDLMQEEADERDDDNLVDVNTAEGDDTEWEPQTKRPRVKKEPVDIADPNAPPKRKRGRPRKGTTSVKSKGDFGVPELGEDQRPVATVTRAALPATAATFIIGAGPVGRAMVEVQTEGEYGRRNLIRDEAESGVLGGNKNRIRIGAVKVQSCQYCGEDVPVSNLVSHLDAHERPQYLCPFCPSSEGAPFRAPRLAMARHLQEFHYDQLMYCEVCPAKFHSSQAAAMHHASHMEGKYECIECHIRFNSSDELCNHQLTAHHPHQFQERLVCTLCGKAFNLRSKYLSHVVKMHRGQVDVRGVEWGPRGHLVCVKCKKKFRKVSLFLEHEKHHLTTDYQCHLCYSKYSKESSLVDHLLAHQFGDQECQDCNARFSSVLHLSQHREKVHNDPPSNACELCGKAFRTKVLLICHRRKYHPESEECRGAKFECTECSMKFVVRGNLIRHMKTHTSRRINDNIACGICNKVLSSKYTLATHMRCHSTLKMHKCAVCEKGFRSKYTLNDHMRRVHDSTGIGRDKVCHQCGRSFFTKSELNYHLNTHTGFRPFKCPVCEDTYMSSSSLRYHLQKHSNSIFTCQHCPAKFKNYVGWSSHLRRVHQITSVKDYARKQGILGSLIKEEPKMESQQGHAEELNEPGSEMAEFYIVDSEGMLVTPRYGGDQNTTDLASATNDLHATSTSGLPMDLDENIVLASDRVAKIIHIVPYDDLADTNNHMAVHTVEEDDTTGMSGETITADVIPSAVVTDDAMSGDVIANSAVSGNPIADDVIPSDVIGGNIIPDVISDDAISHVNPPPSTVFITTSLSSSPVSASFASTSPAFVSAVFTSPSVPFPTSVSAFPSSTTSLTTANTSHLEHMNQVARSGGAKNSFPLDSNMMLHPSSSTMVPTTADQMNKGFLEVDVGIEDDEVHVNERSEEVDGKGTGNTENNEKEEGGNDEGWFVRYVDGGGE
ncbi:uncharacterized protein LOC143038601 isoform X1 [Oratosquilla oratoria]|uniref:uncharacterized protein LOC143038601 isoform X1 n=1 Tax=Oratosquilla oratoria TaxID=337810 RepID=UPI003F762C63